MNFRFWLQLKWYEHVDEIIMIDGTEPSYTIRQYINKNKWWLKREYRHKYQKATK
jgi:hypothetical protein